MYSLSTRANKFFFWGLFHLAAAAILCHLSWYSMTKGANPIIQFSLNAPKKFFYFNKGGELKWDQFDATFNLSIKKLSVLNNWNVKQLFIFVQAVWDEKGKR